MTTERVPTVTVADLRREIDAYERVYQMGSEEFLKRCEDASDDLADVEDAVFWREAHVILARMLEEGGEGEPPDWTMQPAEITSEGSKEPSLLLWTSIHTLVKLTL